MQTSSIRRFVSENSNLPAGWAGNSFSFLMGSLWGQPLASGAKLFSWEESAVRNEGMGNGGRCLLASTELLAPGHRLKLDHSLVVGPASGSVISQDSFHSFMLRWDLHNSMDSFYNDHVMVRRVTLFIDSFHTFILSRPAALMLSGTNKPKTVLARRSSNRDLARASAASLDHPSHRAFPVSL
ncbi:hypothetical protein RRG08_023345 [Elysia crispata]|uniref:Uncharacterized protein n=1 Tax=Elysia crispata TaxID=231223 RepID=A0AAE1BCW0_9GAST|nr:hypothetical protein RRG08_023345 [Elysia crispata]